MEKELARLEEVVVKISESNLDDEAKKIILEVMRKRIFDLRSSLSVVKQNVEFYQNKSK